LSNNSSAAGGDPIHRNILVIALAAILTGCSNDSDRVAQIALLDADRQAKQNEKLLGLQHKVAKGARDLVAADSASRATLAQVHQDIQGERVQLGQQRDHLESDRRTIASQRRTDPVLQQGFEILSMLAAAAAPLGLCWLLLRQSASAVDSTATAEILLNERLHGND
jgi:uncharacterized protein involved in exopolysaccharide biosynthesis